MLRKLTIKNFKTHDLTKLEFSPRVNIITGDSGCGKSNILRAINWIVTNRPLGDTCIRRGEKGCITILDLDCNGETYNIVRKRGTLDGNTENIYGLGKDDQDIAKFESFGNSPPEDISEVLNLSDINIHKQLQPFFLVYDSPGQVALYIRTVTKLDEIDQVIKLLASKIRSEEVKIEHFKEDLKAVDSELEEISKIDLDRLEELILEFKAIVTEDEKIKDEVAKTDSIVRALEKLDSEWIQLPSNVNELLRDIEEQSNQFVQMQDEKSKLEALISRLEEIEEWGVKLPEDLSILLLIEGEISKFTSGYKEFELLSKLVNELSRLELQLCNIDAELELVKKEERVLMENLQVCPSCGTVLTLESKACLLESYKS